MTKTRAINMPIFFTIMLNFIVLVFICVILVCYLLLSDLLISGSRSTLLPRFLHVALPI